MVVTAAAAVTLATSSCMVGAVVVHFVKKSVRLGFLCLMLKNKYGPLLWTIVQRHHPG